MSMILFNGSEITSNEQFIVLSQASTNGKAFPITIFHNNLRYCATWNYITNIEFLDDGIIKPTIFMQSVEISENAKLESNYNIKIVRIKPHICDPYTEFVLELQNQQ